MSGAGGCNLGGCSGILCLGTDLGAGRCTDRGSAEVLSVLSTGGTGPELVESQAGETAGLQVRVPFEAWAGGPPESKRLSDKEVREEAV